MEVPPTEQDHEGMFGHPVSGEFQTLGIVWTLVGVVAD